MLTDSKIVFISNSNSTHGAELCMTETVNALNLKGCGRITVLLQPGGQYLEKLLRRGGAIIEHIDINPRWVGSKDFNWKKKLSWLRSSLIAFKNFSKTLRKLRPDFVVTNTVVCNPVFALATRLYGCKHVWYIHELGDKDHNYRYHFGKRFTWFVIKMLSDKIIVNSEFTLRHFVKEENPNEKKIKVIYYAVPIDRFKENDSEFAKDIVNKWITINTWKILIAGRTVTGKGQEDIIKALAVLKKTYGITNFHLTILGQVDGEYSAALQSLIEEHGLMTNITMIPFTEDPSQFYKEAHIGVTTSRSEAFGRVTVEYMKCNMVVVGADAGGTSEIVENNVTGYLYSLGNITQFAELIFKIMSDKNGSSQFASRARAAIEKKFNIQAHGLALEEFLFKN